MNQNDKSEAFRYTYSAKEQAELRRIREKYAPKAEKEDKMAYLRKLDASVTRTAQIVSLILGIVGTLVFGFGLSLCMTDFSGLFGIDENTSMLVGIIVGICGGILAGLAYPVYNAIVKHRRKKLAPEIIRLTDELMN